MTKAGRTVPKANVQGSLDGLCGVYAVMNSVSLLLPRPLPREDVKSLFRRLCGLLEQEGRLADALAEGLTIRTLGRLIDEAGAFLETQYEVLLTRQLAFREEPVALDVFWDRLRLHVDEHGAGSAIIGLSGKHDHWTCVRTMSEAGISLQDSDGLGRLNRSSCTTADVRGRRCEVVWPTQTYLLSLR